MIHIELPTRKHAASPRQRLVREHSRHLPLTRAVRTAVGAFFDFRYRDSRSKALWSESEQVWLGSETFLYWSLCDDEIDIPWVVARAPDAPQDPEELRRAVRAELVAYWSQRRRGLPRTDRPRWLPLP